jgi:catechol-2,3-dioxygenase
MLLKKSFWLTVVLAASAHAAQRPRIVGIANIAVKVDHLDEARRFYSGVVGTPWIRVPNGGRTRL